MEIDICFILHLRGSVVTQNTGNQGRLNLLQATMKQRGVNSIAAQHAIILWLLLHFGAQISRASSGPQPAEGLLRELLNDLD